MAKYTKAQVDAAIALLIDNTSHLITPSMLRGVLAYLRDMEQLASYIKHTNAFLGTATVEDALLAISSQNIPAWSAKAWPAGYFVFHSGILYRSNQEILATDEDPTVAITKWDTYRPGGSGGDFNLNYKGKYDMTQYAALNILFPTVLKGDFWIADGITGEFNVHDLDWVIALTDGAAFELEYDTAEWMIIPFNQYGIALSSTQIRDSLSLLTLNSRLTKSSVRGADFSLNRRGKGDIYDSKYITLMTNILKGDFWIYHQIIATPPQQGQTVVEGDWVIAMDDDVVPSLANYEDPTKFWIVHFGDVTSQTIALQHYRTSPTSEGDNLFVPNMHVQVVSVTINKATYYGKLDDGNFGIYDFVYRNSGVNTEILLNSELLGFSFVPSMTVDILYIAP